MFKFGEDKEIIGGFFGAVQLRRYYYHGPDGSLLKYGEFQNLDSIDPPDATTTTLAPTTIGTVTVSGDTTPTEGDTATYSVSNNGDASNLSYAWSITGGTGSSTTDSCQVVWGTDGSGQVSCTITSTDPLVADSPATGSLSITIVAVTTQPPTPTPNAPTNVSIITSDYTPIVPTSIGNVSISGNISPTEGDVVSYLALNDGDAGNLTYNWTIVGGTGSSTTDTCEVTWGPDGAGSVSCTITSGDDAPTDSPASSSISVTINAVPTTAPPTTTPSPGTGPLSLDSVYSYDNDSDQPNTGFTDYSNQGDGSSGSPFWAEIGGVSDDDNRMWVDINDDGTLEVLFDVSSEEDFDGLTAYLNSVDAPSQHNNFVPYDNSIGGNYTKIGNGKDGVASGILSASLAVSAGDHLVLQYTKDDEDSDGRDNGRFSIIHTPSPSAGITPVNDNQVRFYVPASANSFTVMGMTNTGYFAVSDGTNTSPIAGSSYYTGTSYFYMYGNGPATLNTLVAGDRVIRLYPTDAAGTYDPNGIIYGFSLTSNTEPVTGVDLSYCTGLKYAGMSSVDGNPRKQFGSVVNSLAPSAITEVRAVNVVLGTDPQSYYSATYNPQYYNGWYWNGGGGDLAGQQMSAAALDQFYTDLISDAGDPSLGTLIVSNNPGTSSDDPTIATGKGYTVSG